MMVLGSGVIACEYASIFAALGCAVTLLDKAPEPLGFWIRRCVRDFLAFRHGRPYPARRSPRRALRRILAGRSAAQGGET
jgi:NADPH-dependent 2,4-dienoyl-CoA reductase/sulfur reductase-like enzyme